MSFEFSTGNNLGSGFFNVTFRSNVIQMENQEDTALFAMLAMNLKKPFLAKGT